MEIQENQIDVVQKAEYYCNAPQNPKEIWILIHGYRQLARFFLQKFDHPSLSDKLLVAIQAPSVFYLEGYTGRVGGSWMTNHQREMGIQNYISIYEQITHSLPDLPINILGFSQGVATACRMAFHSSQPIQHLIACSGGIPQDVLAEPEKFKQQFERLDFLFGIDDPFRRFLNIKEHMGKLEELQIPYACHLFDGDHIINQKLTYRLMTI